MTEIYLYKLKQNLYIIMFSFNFVCNLKVALLVGLLKILSQVVQAFF